ncbi:hypothetical protein WN944_012286 [Citrus x changshan-huyou]|uniref:Uncharacterized protein n=1 Tax=Citrus x changshan-huyou TaxID=2935761 RepID=A0AAP0N1F2_9ROSI
MVFLALGIVMAIMASEANAFDSGSWGRLTNIGRIEDDTEASSAREPYRAIQFHATDVALLITIAMEVAPLTLTAVVAPPSPTARGPLPNQLIDS